MAEPLYKQIQTNIMQALENDARPHLVPVYHVQDLERICPASISTVRRALRDLEGQGLVERTSYGTWRSVGRHEKAKKLWNEEKLVKIAQKEIRDRQVEASKQKINRFKPLLERHNVHFQIIECYGVGAPPVSIVIGDDCFDTLETLLNRLNR